MKIKMIEKVPDEKPPKLEDAKTPSFAGEAQIAKSGAVKNDKGKLRYDLMPARPLQDIVTILTLGADKYADRNWEKGFPWSRPYAALMRHLWAWWMGQDKDPEWGMSHLAHAACCLIFLMEFEYTHPELDDRVKS